MKVLIISHNPATTQNQMGITFLSLFSEFEKEELCQLYIYPTIPNQARCNSFFRITDKEMLQRLFWRKSAGAEITPDKISASEGVFESAGDEAVYRNRKNKSAGRRLLRDGMWAFAGWYGKELKGWLDREEPDCIFVAPGAAKFLYNFALKISKERHIPIVTYLCDEYYFVKRPKQLLDRVRLCLLKRKIEKLMNASSHLAVISEELKIAYTKKFGIEASVLMTGAGIASADRERVTDAPTEIHYFGNIRCNRFVSLCEIGRELDDINRELGTDYRLNIYTFEKDEDILNGFEGIESIKLCGSVSGSAFVDTFFKSQLLLHVEAFDEVSKDYVRHSVSTKIADSLASGIPLLAYGPGEISSMKYLARHDCALIAEDRSRLREMLIRAFTDKDARVRAVKNALPTARMFHDKRATSLRLKEILTQTVEGNIAEE